MVKHASIRDIAERAGVSMATVSRVLNGHPDVSAKTRAVVLQQVRQAGYVSNRVARAAYDTGLVRASRGKRAAIRDVAALAGVSVATVSRVLNDRPDVSDATRDLVLQKVQAAGYFVNRTARALASGRTGLIAVVLPSTDSGYYSGIVMGVNEALYERDCRMVLCPTHHQHDREVSLVDRLMSVATDGILLITPMEGQAELRRLRGHMSPLVVIDPILPLDEEILVVSVANWAGGRVATEHLIDLHHTRIGIITGPEPWCASADRLAGYRSAMVAADLPLIPEYVQPGDFLLESGERAAEALLALPHPPTAIFACSDAMAIGVLRVARRRGLSVPEDLSVVGFDDVEIARVAMPELTTVRQPLREVGRQAISLLFRQIEGRPLSAHRVELSARLVVRASTAPPCGRG